MLRVGCPAAQGVEAARAPTPRALCDCFRQSRRALVTKGGCGEGRIPNLDSARPGANPSDCSRLKQPSPSPQQEKLWILSLAEPLVHGILLGESCELEETQTETSQLLTERLALPLSRAAPDKAPEILSAETALRLVPQMPSEELGAERCYLPGPSLVSRGQHKERLKKIHLNKVKSQVAVRQLAAELQMSSISSVNSTFGRAAGTGE
ncbi:hypothetical protein Y1Q_0000189 [Alligator mississippiensis]|uniref:Uncharacterized protein n=1 Tax=Alligator mississippiensis TaxID=8496 RepID=A0A151MZP3_ALLMI|nr:hypothetical protein Y1Q_0000189 [Alligator mississippiensis]